MKILFWSLLSLLLISIGCSQQTESNSTDLFDLEIPDTLVEKSLLTYNHKISLWTLQDEPYSGYAVSYYSDNNLKEKFGILDGKKQNAAIQWYPDGHFKNVSNYHLGKLHGEKKIWSDDSIHILIAQHNYHTGKPHGEQKKWYPTGELFKKLNLNRGKEEGIQQAFRKNGDLYANYEAREGRIFGLKKASLCYTLEDEKIKTKDKVSSDLVE